MVITAAARCRGGAPTGDPPQDGGATAAAVATAAAGAAGAVAPAGAGPVAPAAVVPPRRWPTTWLSPSRAGASAPPPLSRASGGYASTGASFRWRPSPVTPAAVAAVAAAAADAAATAAAIGATTGAATGGTSPGTAGVGGGSAVPPLRLALPGATVEGGQQDDATDGGTIGIRTRRGVKVKLRFSGGGGERAWGAARAWLAALKSASRTASHLYQRGLVGPPARLGVGTFSVVTAGVTRPPAAAAVALKMLDIRSMRRVDRAALAVEVALLRRLRHPSIVALVDTVESDGKVVLVTEAAAGGTVKAALKAAAATAAEGKTRHAGAAGSGGRPLPRDLTRDLLRDVLAALAHLHARGVVHRDVSAANVLLRSPPPPLPPSPAAATARRPKSPGGSAPPPSPPPLQAALCVAARQGPTAPAGVAVLADFGLAVLPPSAPPLAPPPAVARGSSDILLPPLLYPAPEHEPLPRAAPPDNLTARVGTTPYVAPEVTTSGGGRTYGAAADVWSAGVLAYECLTGRLPFRGDNAAAVWAAARRGLPPDGPLGGGGGEKVLSPAATSLLRGLLCTRPATRLTAAAALAAHPYFNPSMTVEGDDEVVVVIGGRPRLAAVACAVMAAQRLASMCGDGSAAAPVVLGAAAPAAPAAATTTTPAATTATATATAAATAAATSTATATADATAGAAGMTLTTPPAHATTVEANWGGSSRGDSGSFAAAAAAARAALAAADIAQSSRRLRAPPAVAAAAAAAAALPAAATRQPASATAGDKRRKRGKEALPAGRRRVPPSPPTPSPPPPP
ncbi:hypothetical protein I4F81_002193 [Pyropia yezoensis]|uniref:Uncharacterized protein n=1 Tax=Pyropia yezoensis TaxID=2788 RepID=A0ACC3BNV5_PYRYE|nr:hypothetical protein I4F81_002193 [Neopyropia yezoensis]